MVKIFDDKSNFSIEHRMLNMVLALAIVIALSAGVIDYLMDFRVLFYINLVSLLVLLLLYWLSVGKKQYNIAAYSLIVIFGAVVPIIWVVSNGILGGAIYYIIMYTSLLAVLLNGRIRVVALILFIIAMMILIIIDNNIGQYADLYLGLVSTVIVLITFFSLVKSCYYDEIMTSRNYLLQIEKKNTQIEMIRLDRLNIIGEMAASIGHEVRNPLTTVRGYLQLFQGKEKYIEHSTQFQTMIDELDRANSIITEFLSLARNKSVMLKNDNLNRIINVLFPLLKADGLRLGKNLLLELGNIPDLMLDENEIRQCIINFVKNGFEAIEGEGLVILRTYQDRDNVVLAVQDNGCGISDEIYEKLGTPFLTSKPQGTGLGIAICYRIAERHNAQINVGTSSTGTIISMVFDTQAQSTGDQS